MKILIAGIANLKFMPYLNFYADNIDLMGNETHIAFWDRLGLGEDASESYPGAITHRFDFRLDESDSALRKAVGFWRYRAFLLRLLRKGGYDFVISLHTMPGLLMLPALLKSYRGRYIFDYRDYTYEWFRPFRDAVKKLAMNAAAVFVSSSPYRAYVDGGDMPICATHNMKPDFPRTERANVARAGEIINIAFWGVLRDSRHYIEIVDRLGGDSRFRVLFYGRRTPYLNAVEKHCLSKRYGNVEFLGEYAPSQLQSIASGAHILLNSYCDFNSMMAMTNKYYEAVAFKIPQVCMPGSETSQRCLQAGIGVALDPSDAQYAKKIYDYYASLDFDRLALNCRAEDKRVMDEYSLASKTLNNVLNSQS